MIEFLLATVLSCEGSQELIDKIQSSNEEYKEELIETIKSNTQPKIGSIDHGCRAMELISKIYANAEFNINNCN